MAQMIPKQWLGMERSGFDTVFGITSRCCDAFERLTALNLQAIQFGVAETLEAVARMGGANNLPAMLCLPTLLAPAGFAQALSYNRQFFEIVSDLQRGYAAQPPLDPAGERRLADNLLGALATQSLVPSDVPAMPGTSAVTAATNASAGTTATERHRRRPQKPAILPTHRE